MAKNNEVEAEYIHEEDLGQVHIADQVIAVCAMNATMKVAGVAELSQNLTGSLQESLLHIESMTKGVKVDQTEEGIDLDIYVNVKYGVKIPQIAWDIQTAVKAEVESMTDQKVHRIDVHVQGVVRS